MPNTIEKLIKRLEQSLIGQKTGREVRFVGGDTPIIAHGVTVQEWISVKDRLPTEEDAIKGGFVLANTEEKVIIALWSDVCRFNEFVTHWMPLPQPPKGE